MLAEADAGTLVGPSKITVKEHIEKWFGDRGNGLGPKTLERYSELANNQIYPHLGALTLQKLRPVRVKDWHADLLKAGSKKGRPLSARSVGHAHRVLHKALQRAVECELVSRNVASVISPPTVAAEEVEILTAEQVLTVLRKREGHSMYSIVAVDLATGLRRGELLALAWNNIDLEAATLRVERSLEQTKASLAFKPPKTKHGKRTISLPPHAINVLRTHRWRQLEIRLQLGLGKIEPDALVFSNEDGTPPNNMTRRWQDVCVSRRLPQVMFHALRHTHASALIAAGNDVVKISRRLGHAEPTVTLRTYAHLFDKVETTTASAIELALTQNAGTR